MDIFSYFNFYHNRRNSFSFDSNLDLKMNKLKLCVLDRYCWNCWSINNGGKSIDFCISKGTSVTWYATGCCENWMASYILARKSSVDHVNCLISNISYLAFKTWKKAREKQEFSFLFTSKSFCLLDLESFCCKQKIIFDFPNNFFMFSIQDNWC